MRNKYLLALCLACTLATTSLQATSAESAEPEHVAKLRVYLGEGMNRYNVERFTPEFVETVIEVTRGTEGSANICWALLEKSKNEYLPAFKEKFQQLCAELDIETKSTSKLKMGVALACTDPAHFDELVSTAKSLVKIVTRNESAFDTSLFSLYNTAYLMYLLSDVPQPIWGAILSQADAKIKQRAETNAKNDIVSINDVIYEIRKETQRNITLAASIIF